MTRHSLTQPRGHSTRSHTPLSCHAMRALLLLVLILRGTSEVRKNPDFDGEAPAHTKLLVDAPEVRDALRYMMTELKRLSNRYRYASLAEVHGAASGPANFDGHNLFLDVDLDMLRGQRSRHDVIIFKDEAGVINGMAIDEFPEVELRGHPDPDV